MTETRGGEEEGDWTVDAHATAMAAAIRAANLPVFAEGGEITNVKLSKQIEVGDEILADFEWPPEDSPE